jgi:pyridinium-3,5-bisthiocarboxylic acid mononucleotide nickel chelatase
VGRLAYLDCVGGIAGDMLLAALVDGGAPVEALRSVPRRLGLRGIEIEVVQVERGGLRATHVIVTASEQTSERDAAAVQALVDAADLPERAKRRSLDVFARLASAEGKVHGLPPARVHLHEVGAADALVDVCGSCLLLEELDVDRVACSPLPVARGLVRASHGSLPLPAPATLELLVGAPLEGVDEEVELVTPTGAALVAVLADSFGPLPPLVLDRVGVGAGMRELRGRPNVVRVLLGAPAQEPATTPVSLLETNLDDLVPELIPDAVERCFAAGALDVWTVPAQMKKGRPGVVLSALVRRAGEAAVAAAILEETSALGVRVSRLSRYELEREEQTVQVRGGTVRVKIGRLNSRVVNVSPEHDDCVALARRLGRPVKSVWAEALAAVQQP